MRPSSSGGSPPWHFPLLIATLPQLELVVVAMPTHAVGGLTSVPIVR
jgi:hypothetical protein